MGMHSFNALPATVNLLVGVIIRQLCTVVLLLWAQWQTRILWTYQISLVPTYRICIHYFLPRRQQICHYPAVKCIIYQSELITSVAGRALGEHKSPKRSCFAICEIPENSLSQSWAKSKSKYTTVFVSDVVLETKVLVSRRLEDKKIKSWSWSWGKSQKKSWEFSRLLWVWLIAGTKNNNLGCSG